ncbi:MAG TPA: helix-turn-helix domain-containing protein [bacterium]|nr:helix-turn-helix domain-containing protein [bacterium]
MEKLLDIDQAAEILGVKVWTLRAWVSQRKIPYVKIGRLVRFEANALRVFIDNNSVLPAEFCQTAYFKK